MVVGIDKRLKDLLSTSCDYNECLFYKWFREENIMVDIFHSKDTGSSRVEYHMMWREL
jgi:hypothetical protein